MPHNMCLLILTIIAYLHDFESAARMCVFRLTPEVIIAKKVPLDFGKALTIQVNKEKSIVLLNLYSAKIIL